MTNQEIFTKVKNHLLTQNCKATEQKVCRYRTANGLKCAIGCLIPDDVYTRNIEHKTVDLLCSGVVKDFDYLKQFDKSFLRRLQVIHDNVDVDKWENELKAFARLENLVFDETGTSTNLPPEAA